MLLFFSAAFRRSHSRINGSKPKALSAGSNCRQCWPIPPLAPTSASTKGWPANAPRRTSSLVTGPSSLIRGVLTSVPCLGRHSGNNAVRRNITRHHSAGADHAACADAQAWQDRGASPDEGAVLYDDVSEELASRG